VTPLLSNRSGPRGRRERRHASARKDKLVREWTKPTHLDLAQAHAYGNIWTIKLVPLPGFEPWQSPQPAGDSQCFRASAHAQCRSVTLGDASELHSGFTHCGRVNRFAATTAAATRTSATPPGCGLRDQPKAGRSEARVVHALRPQRLPLPRREATQAGRGATQGGGTCTLTCVP
jgi:hypothetical protein